ncbi:MULTISPECIES: hypothetical protein [unclassified Cytobacillus]|nr:hypothetical protein [Cytobacillus sp. AMY 15.2]MCM3093780.1 hypothetical protein [Cytobacillus sp. AMY 15.2]
MDTEIKLRINEIERALSKLQSSANGLQPSFHPLLERIMFLILSIN